MHLWNMAKDDVFQSVRATCTPLNPDSMTLRLLQILAHHRICRRYIPLLADYIMLLADSSRLSFTEK